jgi:hypothetical protein
MNFVHAPGARLAQATLSLFIFLLLAGCATHRVDWNARIGNYTFDEAVLEYGPPDKDAVLSDGTRVAEWLTYRGQRTMTAFGAPMVYGPGYYPYAYRSSIIHYHELDSPDSYLRLTFGPEGRLLAWRRLAR